MSTTTSQSGRLALPELGASLVRTLAHSSSAPRVVVLLTAALAITLGNPYVPQYLPVSAFVPVILLAGVVLPVRALAATYVAITTMIIWVVAFGTGGPYYVAPFACAATMGTLLATSYSRSQHGVGAFTGDRMIMELRDSLFAIGEIPPLPAGWHAERAFATAHHQAFSGDFDVAVLQEDHSRLEVILVDVAGHGQKVATRSLALSGALSGLVGQVDPAGVLTAANGYLARANWDEGYATAVHLDVDLENGCFNLAHAGHPPAVQFVAATGQWQTVTAALGPALGLLPDAVYPRVEGVLEPGDALLVYTDGVVESPTADVADGIDWMLGRAEASVGAGLSGLTTELVRQGRAGEADDRAAILIRRS